MSEQLFANQDQRVQRLLQIAVDLASTLNINELLQQILSAAVEFSHAEEASILLYDAQRRELFIRAATNDETEETLREIAVPTESIAGWVALNRQPIIVDDVHQDPRWFSRVGEALQFPTRSLLAIPMIAKEQLIGVLELLNKKEGRLTKKTWKSSPSSPPRRLSSSKPPSSSPKAIRFPPWCTNCAPRCLPSTPSPTCSSTPASPTANAWN